VLPVPVVLQSLRALRAKLEALFAVSAWKRRLYKTLFCSVIVGEREVFVILTIPVCSSESDLKIMCDCLGGEIQRAI